MPRTRQASFCYKENRPGTGAVARSLQMKVNARHRAKEFNRSLPTRRPEHLFAAKVWYA